MKDSREHLKKKFKTGKELIGYGFKYQDIESDDETDSNEDTVENSDNYTLWKLGNNDTQSEDSESESGDSESESGDSESEDCQSESDYASCDEEEEDIGNVEEEVDWTNIFVYDDDTIYERKRGDLEYLENGDVKIDGEVYDEDKIRKCDDDGEIDISCGLVMKHPEVEENVL